MKAIETVYKGYRFRSRLEARWAVFFDEVGIKYQYEPEGFDLDDAGFYLPDFWIPCPRFFENGGYFIEIKPTLTLTRQEIKKLRYLSKMGHTVILLCDDPVACISFTFKNGDIGRSWANDTAIGHPAVRFVDGQSGRWMDIDFDKAATKARRARFEHGEAP